MDNKRTAYHCYVVRYYKEADEEGIQRGVVVLTFPSATRPSWKDEDVLLFEREIFPISIIERFRRMYREGKMRNVDFKQLNAIDAYIENDNIVVNIGRNASFGLQIQAGDSVYLHSKGFPKQKSIPMDLKWVKDVELDTE